MLTGQGQGTRKHVIITVQDNIETTHLATGAPVSACVALLTNGDTENTENCIVFATTAVFQVLAMESVMR